MLDLVKRLLVLPGVQYIGTRFGGKALRRVCFDQKFKCGDWDWAGQPPFELASVIAKYSGGGDILMLGCGTGSVASLLPQEVYSSFRGIDLSNEAIRRARIHESDKIRFDVGDMTEFKCTQIYKVIIFSESLYYVSTRRQNPMLKELSTHLCPGGCIIVTIAEPRRYESIISMIRLEFEVVEDRVFEGSCRRLLVFR
jgi:trans-aconitate methyltransferase